MRKQEKGITLIALVVTIVVLLILAGTSIAMLTGENGIITEAVKSQEENEKAEEKEKIQLAAQAAKSKTQWEEITQENLEAELNSNIGSGKYTLTKDGDKYTVTYTDSNRSYEIDADGNVTEVGKNTGGGTEDDDIQEIPDRNGLQVGDYVDYIPNENKTGYTTDKLIEEITGSTKNTSTINQDQQYTKDGTGMTWQILRIHEDGSIDLIGSPTSQDIYFKGANGYNNGVTVMNDICETLYSNEELNTTARSVNYEDIEYWLTDIAKEERDGFIHSVSGVKYGQTKTYISEYHRYYPNLCAQEKGNGIDTETVNTIGLGISDKGTASGYTQASTCLTVTQTYWKANMNNTNFGEGYNALETSDSYWFASRWTSCGSNEATFSLGFVNEEIAIGDTVFSSAIGAVGMFDSHAGTSDISNCLRPIVSLKSTTKIEMCIGINDVDNMHKIIQY